MSYANGIGGPQQVPAAVNTTSATQELQQSVSTASTTVASKDSSGSDVRHADQASLSTAGNLVAQGLEVSDVRSEKIASIQQAIAGGTYNVSSSDVAGSIIQSLLEKE